MNDKIDVLAVLDQAIGHLSDQTTVGGDKTAIALMKARAAIAELIEAASTRIEWRNGLWFVLDREGLPLSGGHESEAAARFEQTEALHEALARVGGS